MRRPVVLSLLALAVASSVASAQPSLTQSGPPGLTPPTMQLTPAPEATGPRKDPSTAVLLSLGITTASYITLFAADNESLQMAGFIGTYLGPSTGQWYAGQVGGLGLGLRAAGFVMGVYGISQMLASECDDIDGNCSGADAAGARGALFFWGGAGLWVGSSIYDIVLAKRAADSWNVRHNVNLAPTTAADISGHRAPGLAFTGRF